MMPNRCSVSRFKKEVPMFSRLLNHRPIFVVALLLSATLVLAGCGGGNAASPDVYRAPAGPGQANSALAVTPVIAAQQAALAPPAPTVQAPSQPGQSARSAPNAPSDSGDVPVDYAQQQHVVLKNATLTLTVESPAQTISQVTQLAEGIGGWVVSSNTTGGVQN